MQISEISDEELNKIVKIVSGSEVDIFYFADSLGNLDPSDIKHFSNIIKKNWRKTSLSCS